MLYQLFAIVFVFVKISFVLSMDTEPFSNISITSSGEADPIGNPASISLLSEKLNHGDATSESINKIEVPEALPATLISLSDRLSQADADTNLLEEKINAILEKNAAASESVLIQDYATIQIVGKNQIDFISQELAHHIASRSYQGMLYVEYDCASHPVSHEDGVYFKTNIDDDDVYSYIETLNYPREHAAYYFQRLLVGEGIAPTTFCVLKHIRFIEQNGQIVYRNLFCQASLGVEGVTLHEYFEKMNLPDLKQLDHKSVSATGITSLLLWPADAKGENFVVDHEKKLIAIDSDIFDLTPFCYLRPFNDVYPSPVKKGAFINWFKNILFLMPSFLKSSPHMDIRLLVINTPRDEFLYTWFQAMIKMNGKLKSLAEEGDVELDQLRKHNFPLCFSLKRIEKLPFQMTKLQFWLKRGLTFGDLFRNINPLSYLYYKSVRKREGIKHKNPNEALGEIFLYDYDNPPHMINYLKDQQNDILKNGRRIKDVISLAANKEWKASFPDEFYPINELYGRIFEGDPSTNSMKVKKSSYFDDYMRDNQKIVSRYCFLFETRMTHEQGFILKNHLLSHHHVLHKLDLHENFFPSDAANWLSPLLNTQLNLMSINLCDNDLQASGVKKLMRELPLLPYLKILNLSGNYIKDKGVRHLSVVVVNQLPKLKKLFLAENQISEESEEPLFEIINSLKKLKLLDLRWNVIANNSLVRLNRHCSFVTLMIKGNRN